MPVGPKTCLLFCIALLAVATVIPTGEASLVVALWCATWIVGGILWCCGRSPLESGASPKSRRRVRVMLFTTSVLLLLRIPFFVGFFFSVAPMSAMGNHLYAEVPFGVPDPGPCRVGLYSVNQIHVGCGGVWFHLSTGATLVYSPAPNHPRDCSTGDEDIVRHLFGPWYVRRMVLDW